jgi:predicted GNAT superfamily acetyltransferase
MLPLTYRDLTTLEEFALVVDLERQIWGPVYDDVVPVSILAVSVHSGGILIGAFDGDRMVGFVYSLPGIKEGKATQWSHMAGVVESHRSTGVGYQLKLLQRERALNAGLDLVQWTYDPLQALNAHLNFSKLGVVVGEYAENIYGLSTSPLHAGLPTDRFVADWWIRRPHVERRLAARESRDAGETAMAGSRPSWTLRDHGVAGAGLINHAVSAGEWLECGDVDLTLDARRLAVEIPTGFTDMLARAPHVALAWRMATRQIFNTYFGRGYRAVEFFLDRPSRKGTYLLVDKIEAANNRIEK